MQGNFYGTYVNFTDFLVTKSYSEIKINQFVITGVVYQSSLLVQAMLPLLPVTLSGHICGYCV